VFTGIISDVGSLVGVGDADGVRRLSVACDYDAASMAVGASIALNGICLTVVSREANAGGSVFVVEAGPETLAVTTLGGWAVGSRINLERALKVGEELGGHLVSGHVDGVAAITGRDDLGATVRFIFAAPYALARFIAAKGSVALDGTSLTVNRADGDRFDCLLIPQTLKVTTWGERRPGDSVNVEVDLVARYLARLIAER